MSADTAWTGDMPAVYDRNLGPALFAPYAEEVASRASALGPRRVLELAAGTGIATSALIRMLPEAQITATDLNPAMVSWAADRVPGATWLQADAQSLDFADASFDMVVCQFGAMFFPDKPAAFAETARVLEPGGSALFAIWDTVESTHFAAALVGTLSTLFPQDPPSFVLRVPHGYADPDQIRADLESGGLQVESIDRVVLPGHSSSARTLAEGFCYGTPLRFALQERGELDALAAKIADEMTAQLGEGPIEGDLTALLATARR